jgi:hypothetical protein
VRQQGTLRVAAIVQAAKPLARAPLMEAIDRYNGKACRRAKERRRAWAFSLPEIRDVFGPKGISEAISRANSLLQSSADEFPDWVCGTEARRTVGPGAHHMKLLPVLA